MDTRVYRTLVQEDHKFGKNNYVKGRIGGYKELICDGENDGLRKPSYAWDYIPGVGEFVDTVCSKEQYDRFRALVERHYPGLCEFDL